MPRLISGSSSESGLDGDGLVESFKRTPTSKGKLKAKVVPKKSLTPRAKKPSPSPEPLDEEENGASDNEQSEVEDESEIENGEEEVVEEGDEDGDEEMFQVEKIVGHELRNGQILYNVKWHEWPSSDNTLEPEENLVTALGLLEAYFKRIGGRPTDEGNPKDNKDKKRGRRSSTKAEPEPPRKSVKTSKEVPERKVRPPRKSQKEQDFYEEVEDLAWPPADNTWEPPKVAKDSWEDILLSVAAVHQDANAKGSKDGLWAYVEWAVQDDNGARRMSKVRLESVHKAAPQAAIRFYQNHLVFVGENKNKKDSS